MQQIEELLRDLDRSWPFRPIQPTTLRVIGSTALFLQSEYNRGTKDGDILETHEITVEVADALRRLAGPGTLLHKRHRIYLEVLASPIPFLPEAPIWHAVGSFTPALAHFQIEALDIVDVVVSKLARFHSPDREDIAAMVERDLVEPAVFTARFRSAVQRWWHDARAEELARIVRNFHQIQTDELFVGESAIELPSWIDADELG